MRSQTLPFLLKKNENYLKIIKVPLHGHKTFGATHTIQYHCIKYCSQCRRGYYNGLNREATPEKVTFFRLQVHEREGSFFIHIVKMVYLQQSKSDAAFKIRYVKGVSFVTTGYTKGVLFLSKMVHTKGKGLVPGAEPLRIKLQ